MKIGSFIMSGHCGNPATHNAKHEPVEEFDSHQRCIDNGGGVTTAGTRAFHPCPCSCHVGEEFECSGCGGSIYEAPTLGPDKDGDVQYVHLTDDGLRFTGVYCS